MTDIQQAWETVEMPAPHTAPPGRRWVKTVAHIRDNKTGEVRRYPLESILNDGDPSPDEYLWEDGNYGCDCNRHLFFQYAVGVETKDATDMECGEGAYSVNVSNPVTGAVFYREFEE